MSLEKIFETDVLVIGGGVAGCVAALKAKEKGVEVTLVDKGYIGRSGQTPYAGAFSVLNPEWGDDLEVGLDWVNTTGEYLNNREWTEICLVESLDRYEELSSWGVDFKRSDTGLGPGKGPGVRKGPPMLPEGAPSIVRSEGTKMLKVMRKRAIETGVNILDRVMIAELLKQDGKIAGAVGIPMESHDFYIFKTNAVIMCVGACGLKPAGYPPLIQLTGDGEAMAYRIGARLAGKEFVDTHYTRVNDPSVIGRMAPGHEDGGPPFFDLVNSEGDIISKRPEGASQYPFTYLQLEFEAHAGRAPIHSGSVEKGPLVGGGALGMSVRKAEGIYPMNTRCESSIPGLYAAGDALGNMQDGTVYNTPGSSIAGGSVTGCRAGLAAAEYASKLDKSEIDKDELSRAKRAISAPLERKGGFSPRWVTQVLQNIMMPYFISYIKKEDRLNAAMTMVAFLRDHMVPMIYANDPHEQRLAIETKNMVLNAEMRLKSALFRTESRGNHFREDFPARNDPDWLAWVTIEQEESGMILSRVPVPEEWWPDLNIPYKERYPFRFPGE
ncbi:FAD-dependent oxidoreductase [Thermodesulfobacteriota bacterium]